MIWLGGERGLRTAWRVAAVALVLGAAWAPGARAANVDMTNFTGPTVLSRDSTVAFGQAVTSAGDINGDGHDDVAVAGFRDKTSRTAVVFGPVQDGFLDVAALAPDDGFIISGVAEDTGPSLDLGGGGDVNGDGYDDLVVGALYSNRNDRESSGSAYVIFGSAAPGTVSLADLPSSRGFRIDGAEARDLAGASVAIVPSVNGDRLADVAISALGQDVRGRENAGAVHVVFGSTAPANVDLRSPAAGATWQIDGPRGGSELGGNAVNGVGDFNGDGFGDIVTQVSGAQTAYVVFGSRTPATVDLSVPPASNYFGIGTGGPLESVAGAGDVNHDGLEDVVLGSWFVGSGGAAWVVYGTRSGQGLGTAGMTPDDGFAITNFREPLGDYVDGAGDLNDDGYDDIALGTSQSSGFIGTFAGTADIVYGAARQADLSVASGVPSARGFRVVGMDGWLTGEALAGVGDLDTDGLDDVLVASPRAVYVPANPSDPDAGLVPAKGGPGAPGAASLISDRRMNSAPTGRSLHAEFNEDQSVNLNLLAAMDYDRTASTDMTYTITDAPESGTLSSISGGQVTYTPKPDFHGTDSFTFTATDRGAPDGCEQGTDGCLAPRTSAPIELTLTVLPKPDAPTLRLMGPDEVLFGTETVTFGVAFDDIDFAGEPVPASVASVSCGGGSVDSVVLDASTRRGELVCRLPDTLADHQVRLEISTPPDDLVAVAERTLRVLTVPPTVGAGGPYATDEGTDVQLAATGRDPDGGDVEFAWDLDGDGGFDDATGATVTFDRVAQDGTFPVAVRATDDERETATTETTVRVANVAPTVGAPQSPVIDEGERAALSVPFTEPGRLDTFTASIDWGTGLPDALSEATVIAGWDPSLRLQRGTATGDHPFGDDGVFTATTTIRDDGGGQRSREVPVTVHNVAPTAAIAPVAITPAGQPVALTARSTDPGSDDLTFAWDLDGDGTVDEENASPASPAGPDDDPSAQVGPRDETDETSATFDGACVREVALEVRDDDGGVTRDEISVVVLGTETERRGSGFWTHRTGAAGSGDVGDAELRCLLRVVGALSEVFDEVTDASEPQAAHAVLTRNRGSADMAQQLDRALLTAWLNVATGALEDSEVLRQAEDVRRDPTAGRTELERAKERVEALVAS